MENNLSRNTILLGAIAVVAAIAIGSLALANVQAQRKNAELVAQAGELQKQLATLSAAQQAVERQLAAQKSEAERAAAVASAAAEELRRKEEAMRPQSLDIGCVDSDGEYGKNAIYYRGSVRVGNGTSFDHCRLGQLVEFSCIETPAGSGILHSQATISDCPDGARCVDGTCLR